MLTFQAFNTSLVQDTPPSDLTPALQSLWWARKGEWHRAHSVVQQHEGEPECDWVHGHLHRQEGDPENARSWYGDAGKAMPCVGLEEEWAAIAADLIAGRVAPV